VTKIYSFSCDSAKASARFVHRAVRRRHPCPGTTLAKCGSKACASHAKNRFCAGASAPVCPRICATPTRGGNASRADRFWTAYLPPRDPAVPSTWYALAIWYWAIFAVFWPAHCFLARECDPRPPFLALPKGLRHNVDILRGQICRAREVFTSPLSSSLYRPIEAQ